MIAFRHKMVSAIILLSLVGPILSYDFSNMFTSQYPVGWCNPFLPYSCENITQVSDSQSCCFEKDGLMLLAQFWDYDLDLVSVAINGTDASKQAVNTTIYQQGAGYFGIGDWLKSAWDQFRTDPSSTMPIEKSFTIHGLWSDKCDGSYEQYCQPDLEIADSVNLTDLIGNKFNKPELLTLMQKYWINTASSNVAGDSNPQLWEHEYNKHATCMNTMNPSCLVGNYRQFEAAVLFYQKVTEIWEQLNTYEFLSKFGILPTVSNSYKLTDIQQALSRNHGDKQVYVGCTSDGVLNEIYYYYVLKGSVLAGDYKQVDLMGPASNCREDVWYLPKPN